MPRLLVCLVALISVESPSAAYSESLGAGVGATTCGEFAVEYKGNPRGTEYVYYNWGLGFMTGLNLVIEPKEKRRDIDGMQPEEKKAFMRIFCDKNPLKIYAAGVIEMFHRLPFAKE